MPLVLKSRPVRLPVALRVPKFAVPASQRLGRFAVVAPVVDAADAPARLAKLIEPEVRNEAASFKNGKGFCPVITASGVAGAAAYEEFR